MSTVAHVAPIKLLSNMLTRTITIKTMFFKQFFNILLGTSNCLLNSIRLNDLHTVSKQDHQQEECISKKVFLYACH